MVKRGDYTVLETVYTVKINIVTDLVKAFPGNSSVKMVHHATIEEAVFSVGPTDAPLYWLDSDHVIYVYCRSMPVPRLYKYAVRVTSRSRQLRVVTAAEAGKRERTGTRSTEDYKKSACEGITC
jgi:hypothetical protein